MSTHKLTVRVDKEGSSKFMWHLEEYSRSKKGPVNQFLSSYSEWSDPEEAFDDADSAVTALNEQNWAINFGIPEHNDPFTVHISDTEGYGYVANFVFNEENVAFTYFKESRKELMDMVDWILNTAFEIQLEILDND